MAKVSIGLRGWRFEETDVLEPDGTLRSVEEMPEDARERVLRLLAVVDNDCDACWLLDGDDGDPDEAEIVYGEPGAEVLLCPDHEPDFLYWYREAGGGEYRGTEEFADAFHEWFLDGGRAPEGYEGVEHVQTEPEDLPEPPEPEEIEGEVIVVDTGERIDLREGEREDELVDATDLDEADVDFDADYPG